MAYGPAGYSQPGGGAFTPQQQNKMIAGSDTKTSLGGGFNLGGLFGSLGSAYAARKAAKIARENREWQEKQNTIAYERSLPWSSQGPAGNVEFDAETKEIISTLSPEFQAQMQGFLGSSAMANEELQSMMGDPYAMEQEQMKRFDAFNAVSVAPPNLSFNSKYFFLYFKYLFIYILIIFK